MRAEPNVAALLQRRGMLLGMAREFAKAVEDLAVAARLSRLPIVDLERSQWRVSAGKYAEAAKELRPLLYKLRDNPRLLGKAECPLDRGRRHACRHFASVRPADHDGVVV